MAKRILCVIFTLLFVCVASVGCAEEEKEEKIPPRELMVKSINEECDFALIDKEKKEILTEDDVESVCVMYPKGGNRYLEIRFTEDGAEKFEDAIEENKKLSAKLGGKVITDNVVANEEYPQRAKIDAAYETFMKWFNEMT